MAWTAVWSGCAVSRCCSRPMAIIVGVRAWGYVDFAICMKETIYDVYGDRGSK
jgi:hypothetical protein